MILFHLFFDIEGMKNEVIHVATFQGKNALRTQHTERSRITTLFLIRLNIIDLVLRA
jgi:hypothetical protein